MCSKWYKEEEGVMFTRWGPKSKMGPICQLPFICLFRARERNLNGDKKDSRD